MKLNWWRKRPKQQKQAEALPWPNMSTIENELMKLKAGERGATYIGGTLDMPISENMGCCLNVCGRGFFFQMHGSHREEKQFYMSKNAQRIVCEIYVAHKSEESAHWKAAHEVLSARGG